MAKYKIETDGVFFYPFIKKNEAQGWEPIMNYYVRRGLVYTTSNNRCNTLDRAKFLIQIVSSGQSENMIIIEEGEI